MKKFLLSNLLVLVTMLAWAHPSPTSAVQLKLLQTSVEVQLILPVVELKLGWDKPFPLNDANTVVRDYGQALREYIHDHVRPVAPNGQEWTVQVGNISPIVEQVQDVRVNLVMTPPVGQPVEKFTFNYDVIFHHLVTHEALVTLASDWKNGLIGGKPIVLATMRDTNPSIQVDRSKGSWWRGFTATFMLGTRHIAEGTDHLLFLLALLLPAPLLATGKKWGGFAGGKAALYRILKVVTAFTVGHSVTLVLGAMHWVRLPSVVIESAIALSIIVSAVHAFFPIFQGREAWIAGVFGLIHGLAFAETLSGIGLDPVALISSILGFNLGIEAFQFLVIVVTMPWLILLAKTRAYPLFRNIGASATGIAASFWFCERAFGAQNPLGPFISLVASRGIWLVCILAVFSLTAFYLMPIKKSETVPG